MYSLVALFADFSTLGGSLIFPGLLRDSILIVMKLPRVSYGEDKQSNLGEPRETLMAIQGGHLLQMAPNDVEV